MNIAELSPTGRKVSGTLSDLIEYTDTNDELIYTAIVYSERYCRHQVILNSVALAINFMQFPMVAGLAALTSYQSDTGRYLYPTGSGRAVSEITRAYHTQQDQPGERAALELCYLVGLALSEAAESGPTQGVYSHGDLSPNRIIIDENGQIHVIGYGIAQPEIFDWRDDPSTPLAAESIRYCPPERLIGGPEDCTSDCYALVMIAYELISPSPLLSGTQDELIEAIKMGRGPERIQQSSCLSKPVRQLFEQALQFDPSLRWSPKAFIQEVHQLLSGETLSGPPLSAIINQVLRQGKQGRSLESSREPLAVPRRGVQLSPGIGRRGPASFVNPSLDSAKAPNSESRWGSVSRDASEPSTRRRRREPEVTTEESTSTSRVNEEGVVRKRRRRGAESSDDPKSSSTDVPRLRKSRSAEASPKTESPTDKPARRRRAPNDEPENNDKPARRRKTPTDEPENNDKPARRRRTPTDEPENNNKPARRRRTPTNEADEEATSERSARRAKRRTPH